MQNKVTARNEDYATIIKKLQFGRQGASVAAADAESPSPRAGDATAAFNRSAMLQDDSSFVEMVEETTAAMQQMCKGRVETSSVAYRSAQAVVWMGDFNYRIDLERWACIVMHETFCDSLTLPGVVPPES
jgi:hypothetical protein